MITIPLPNAELAYTAAMWHAMQAWKRSITRYTREAQKKDSEAIVMFARKARTLKGAK